MKDREPHTWQDILAIGQAALKPYYMESVDVPEWWSVYRGESYFVFLTVSIDRHIQSASKWLLALMRNSVSSLWEMHAIRTLRMLVKA
jgi:hypothetical protein